MTAIQKCKRPLLALALAGLLGTGAAQAYDTCPCSQTPTVVRQPVVVQRPVVRQVKKTRVVSRVVVSDPCDPCDPCAPVRVVRRDPCAPCGEVTVSPSLYSEPVVIYRERAKISVPANTYSCTACPN